MLFLVPSPDHFTLIDSIALQISFRHQRCTEQFAPFRIPHQLEIFPGADGVGDEEQSGPGSVDRLKTVPDAGVCDTETLMSQV